MLKMTRKFAAKLSAGSLALVAAGSALATEPAAPTIDVTDAVATIDGGMSAVTALGGAGLVIVCAIAIYRMVRRAP